MTPDPDLTVLYNLADRAEKGRLTAAESAVLRAGIAHLATQRDADRRTIGGLQARIRTLKSTTT